MIAVGHGVSPNQTFLSNESWNYGTNSPEQCDHFLYPNPWSLPGTEDVRDPERRLRHLVIELVRFPSFPTAELCWNVGYLFVPKTGSFSYAYGLCSFDCGYDVCI